MIKIENRICLALALAAVLSCTTERTDPEPSPQTPIQLSASVPTRAMLDAGSFQSAGTAVQVWDAYFDGDTPEAYMNGVYAVCDGSNAVWPTRTSSEASSDAVSYYWTKTGLHRFYSVLVKDNSVSPSLTSPSGWGFDAAGKVYTVPSTTLDLSSTQYDFVYSDVVSRDLDNNGGTESVSLGFNHLFSAYAFTVTNNSFHSVTIKSVSLNVKTTGSATVDYSSVWTKSSTMTGVPAVTYSLNDGMAAIAGVSSNVLATGSSIDLLKGDAVTTPSAYNSYTLAWPQTLTGTSLDIVMTVPVTTEYYYKVSDGETGNYSMIDAGEGKTGNDYKEDPDNAGHYIYAGAGQGRYGFTASSSGDYKLTTGTTTVDNTYNLSLSDSSTTSWDPGKKYLYNIVFSGIGLDVEKVTVMKWNSGHGGTVTFE